MQDFQRVKWKCAVCTETQNSGNNEGAEMAYWSISDWQIPFDFLDWASNAGFDVRDCRVPEKIYEHCASKLHRPRNKELVGLSQTRLFLDPEHVSPFEKMASFYILKLLACIPRESAWKKWPRVPITESLLNDETFCLAVLALHPVLFGKLHPVARNNRSIFLEAWSQWDLPKYSILQFVHPGSLITPVITANAVSQNGAMLKPYWVFNDPKAVMRVLGKPGARRWFELSYAGPCVIKEVLKQRLRHNNSVESLTPYIKKNKYYKK
tara:strand:- start:7008 stop:7805 length:798 start_codon:yes stop_codon:yes gene_type:complete